MRIPLLPVVLVVLVVVLLTAGGCRAERPVYRPSPDPGPSPSGQQAAPAPGRSPSRPAPIATATAGRKAGPTAAGAVAAGGAGDAGPSRKITNAWAVRCSTCHGARGRGDGPAARMIRPRPRSFADPGWQASVTDQHIALIIVGGGQAVGRSPSMPASPDLHGDKAMVDGLVKLIRSFKM